MGGYGSGRRVRYSLTSECLPVDTSFLLKRKMFTGKKLKQGGEITFTGSAKDIKGKVTETKYTLYCLVERYGEEGGEFSKVGAAGHITLRYGIRRGDTSVQPVRIEIAMVITSCHFGGQRWWFLSPCCGRRVRVLYLPLQGQSILPECRVCLNLNYASQRQGYIERHAAYERHLLRNFGYWWAQDEYRNLKEHYQPITPKLAEMARRSQLTRELEIMKRLIACSRVMLRDHLHALGSLKSEEDRRIYIDHLVKQHGAGYTLDLMRMLRLGVDTAISEEAFEKQYMQLAEKEDQEVAVMTSEQLCFYLKWLIERKRDVEGQLEELQLV